MSVTIHYKGSINKHDDIDKLISELVDISKEMSWKFDVINFSDKGIKGVIINPHEDCESFTLVFNKENAIINTLSLAFDDVDDTFSHIKTQFAPVEIHVAIIKLLKHVKLKYINDLEVFDEGDFWDTMDNNALIEKMNLVQLHIDFVGDVLNASTDEMGNAKSAESLGDKIEAILKKSGYKRE